MNKRELILVCGISGAGKTITMNYFESVGFYCVDNLPISTLLTVVKTLKINEPQSDYAIAINSNTEESEISNILVQLRAIEWLNVKILYLDSSDETVIKRFQFTRKQHPFSKYNETLLGSLHQERVLLKGLRQFANVIIDTSELSDKGLVSKLIKIFNRKVESEFRLCFISFGYKNGLPKDLDYIFDVRFIPNPYYIENLRNKTGNDFEVFDYVMNQNETNEFIKRCTYLLDYCIEKHKDTKRPYLVIGIGCTGGQHRSVTIVNYLSELYSQKYNIIKDHRDAKRDL